MLIVNSPPQLKDAIAILGLLEIGYTRVSTEMGHQDSSIKRQLQDFEDEGCNLAIVERESGTSTDKRSLYQAMIELIKAQKVIKIRVTESSRLNRNEAESTYFERLCADKKVPLLYLDEPELNSGGFRAQQLRKDKAIAAESYSRSLSLNIRKGYDRRKKNIKPIAGKPTFGYRFTSERDYEIDWVKADLSNAVGLHKSKVKSQKSKVKSNAPKELGKSGKYYATAELGRFLIENYIKYESQSQAFKQFKYLLDELEVVDRVLWQKAKNKAQTWFSTWIKDPTIRGHIAYGRYKEIYKGDRYEKKVKVKAPRHEWEIHRDRHEALISQDEWQQIQQIIINNQNKGWARNNGNRDRTIPAPLSRLLRCSECKLTFNTQSTNVKGKKYRYYRCVGRREIRCSQSGIAEKMLVDSLLNCIIDKAQELTEILYAAKTEQKDPRCDRINLLRTEADELLTLHRNSGRNSYLITYQEIISEIKDIEQAISTDAVKLHEKEEVLSALGDLDFWHSMTRVELHDYLKAIVRVAWIEDKQVESVELRF